MLTKDTLTTLTSVCKYMAEEMFYHPVIRKLVRKMYYEFVTISTEPTEKGRTNIDVTKYEY